MTYYLKPEVQNKWHTYKETAIYKKDTYASLGNGCKYLLYIYGITTKMEAYIDDIKVQVSIESTTKK